MLLGLTARRPGRGGAFSGKTPEAHAKLLQMLKNVGGKLQGQVEEDGSATFILAGKPIKIFSAPAGGTLGFKKDGTTGTITKGQHFNRG